MKEKCSLFVPWKPSFKCINNKDYLKHNYKQHQFCFEPFKKPFFGLVNDNLVTKDFIEAVMNEEFEDASLYLSKRLQCSLDFEAIKRVFASMKKYGYLVAANTAKNKRERITSIMISDKDSKEAKLLHLYIVSEPDMYSKWKIYKIELDEPLLMFKRL